MTKADEVIIRNVESGDYEDLVRFFDANSVPQVTRQFHPFPLSASTARYIARTEHLDRYYVALLKGRIIALSMLRGWEEGYSVPSLGILVDHRCHRQGLGARMLRFLLNEARHLGCERVRLSVYASNHAALRLYEDTGFVEDNRESVIVGGEPDERIVMLKDL